MVGRGVLALAVLAIMVIAVGGYFSTLTTTSVPSGIASIASTSSPSLPPSSSSENLVSNRSLVAECLKLKAPSFGFGNVTAGTASPTLICVQLYYYNQNSTRTLNLTYALSIQAIQYVKNGSIGMPRSFDGGSNFTVTASKPLLVLGGPTFENEGEIIGFNITAKPGASGTYQLNLFSSSGLGAFLLAGQQPESCGDYGQLLAGSGSPNYAQMAIHCVTIATTSVSTGHPHPDGYLYFKVLGVSSPAP